MASYSAEVLADSPLVYLKLDETSGTTATDSSGNNNHGTYVGSPTLGQTGLIPVNEPDGKSVRINGTSDYISIPSAALAGIAGANKFAIEMIVNSTSTADNRLAVRAGSLLIRTVGNSAFETSLDSGEYIYDAADVLSANTTTHVVFRAVGGGNMELFINGSSVGTTAAPATIPTGSNPLRIGSAADGYLTGRIDSVAVYTELSNARVAAHVAALDDAPVPPVDAPTFTAGPTITGTPKQGSTLTATYTLGGGEADTVTYQWLSTGVQTFEQEIEGATSQTYVPTADDVGDELWVDVTAENAGGDALGSATQVGPIQPLLSPANTAPPVISGENEVGSTLTVSNGTWTGDGPLTYSYYWEREVDGVWEDAGAEDENTYVTQEEDEGNRIRVDVTATGPGGTASFSSAPFSMQSSYAAPMTRTASARRHTPTTRRPALRTPLPRMFRTRGR